MPFIPFAATVGAALGGSATFGGLAIAGTAAAVGAGVAGSIAKKNAIEEAQEAQQQAQESAQQFAQQQAEEAKVEQQRLEEKFSLSPGELERENRVFELEKQRQTELQRRAGLPGEKLLEESGPVAKQLSTDIQRRLGRSGTDLFLEEGGLPAKQYYDRVTAPTDQGTFSQELELVRQMVNQEANRRGVFGGLPEGGIRFEQLGRAGVELAIKSAREKIAQQQALSTALFNIVQSSRAEAGTLAERGLSEQERTRQELERFLSGQEDVTASARNRELSGTIRAANINDAAQARSFGTQTDIFGQQAGQAAAKENIGLNALGDIAGIAIGAGIENLPKSSPKIENLKSPELLPGGNIGLRTRGFVDDDFLADTYSQIRRRY